MCGTVCQCTVLLEQSRYQTLCVSLAAVWRQLCVCGQISFVWTVKELLKSDSICESYAQMKKRSSFFFDSQCILLNPFTVKSVPKISYWFIFDKLIIKSKLLPCYEWQCVNINGFFMFVNYYYFSYTYIAVLKKWKCVNIRVVHRYAITGCLKKALSDWICWKT